MEIEWLKAIMDLGFPATTALILLFSFSKKIDALSQAMRDLVVEIRVSNLIIMQALDVKREKYEELRQLELARTHMEKEAKS